MSSRTRSLRLPPALWLVTCASLAHAAPHTVAVAAGDCGSADLLTAADALQTPLRTQWAGDLFEPDLVFDLVRPRATRSLEELTHQLESIRTLFYAGQADRAIELLKPAIIELERVPEPERAWPILADAQVFLGNVLRAQNRRTEALESWRKVLRVDPTFAIDTDLYPGTTVQAFEALKKDLSRARKLRLNLTTAMPGAKVFIDGHLMGLTPVTAVLPAATYRVSLVSAAGLPSFVRHLSLQRDERLPVDLGFETALRQQAPLCLALPDPGDQAAAGLKLATTLGADRLVLVRIDSRPNDPPLVRAALYDVNTGAELRSGAVRRLAPSTTLQALATFIATGTASSEVDRSTPTGAASLPAAQPRPEKPSSEKPPPLATPAQPSVTTLPSTPTAPEPPAAVQPTETASLPATSAPTLSTGRWVALGLLTVSVGLAVGSVVNELSGAPSRTALEALTVNGKLPNETDPTFQTALDLQTRIDADHQRTWLLAGASAGALASAALTWWLFPPERQRQTALSLQLTPGQLSLGLSGRF